MVRCAPAAGNSHGAASTAARIRYAAAAGPQGPCQARNAWKLSTDGLAWPAAIQAIKKLLFDVRWTTDHVG